MKALAKLEELMFQNLVITKAFV